MVTGVFYTILTHLYEKFFEVTHYIWYNEIAGLLGGYMGRQVYQALGYKVYRAGNDYIVHHAKYEFEDKHTHLKSLNLAKRVIHYLHTRSVPRTQSDYVLTSLLRLTDDPHYKDQVETLIAVRRQKGHKPKYLNQVYSM
jgi:hypothetical protein